MAQKKMKKDFDKEKMYSKIMPTIGGAQREGGAPAAVREPLLEEQEPAADKPRYLLRNYMEDLVLEKLERTMEVLRACSCEKCKKDVMAEALNELPSSYIAIEPQDVEEQVRQLRTSTEVKVTAALVKAVQKIKAAPDHR